MTHIDNMPHILKYGITHASSPACNPDYIPIGDGSLIGSRSAFITPAGKILGDYIPFYFGGRMPMLYVIQNGYNGVKAIWPADIVYLVCSIEQIVAHKLPFMFTDGHAVDHLSEFFGSERLKEIENIVDFAAVKELFWKKEDDLDLKRRKEAEFLVQGDIPLPAIAGYVVYNEDAKQKLLALNVAKDKIAVRNNFYF